MARVFHPKYAEKWQKSYDIVAKLREAKAAKETAEVNVKGAMSLPEVIVSSVFPPAGVVLRLPEGGEKVLAAVPEAFLGSIIPVIPFITGRTPVEALLTAETGRQIDIVPDVVMPPEDKEKAKEMYTGLWQEGKPWVIGGDTYSISNDRISRYCISKVTGVSRFWRHWENGNHGGCGISGRISSW